MARQPRLHPFGEFVVWQKTFVNFRWRDESETMIVDCRTPKAAERMAEALNQIMEGKATTKAIKSR